MLLTAGFVVTLRIADALSQVAVVKGKSFDNIWGYGARPPLHFDQH